MSKYSFPSKHLDTWSWLWPHGCCKLLSFGSFRFLEYILLKMNKKVFLLYFKHLFKPPCSVKQWICRLQKIVFKMLLYISTYPLLSFQPALTRLSCPGFQLLCCCFWVCLAHLFISPELIHILFFSWPPHQLGQTTCVFCCFTFQIIATKGGCI